MLSSKVLALFKAALANDKKLLNELADSNVLE